MKKTSNARHSARRTPALVSGGAVLFGGALLALGSVLACGDDGDGEAVDREGLQMCCELGARCHIDEGDPIDGEKQACHSIGHENEPAQCRAQYESCMAICDGEGEEHSCL